MPSTPRITADADLGDAEQAKATRTKQERRDQAEQSLLAAASRLVARRGVDQTSVADVGTEAGYSRGLVNHHFGSKVALLQRVAHESQRGLVEVVEALVGDELESLTVMIRSYLTWIHRNPDEARAFFAMWGAALPAESVLRDAFREFDVRIRTKIEEFVRAGQGHGKIRQDVEPAGVAAAITGLLRGTGAQLLLAQESLAFEEVCATCELFARRMLAVPETPDC
ncbi:TetR/AcrR family transcriptional regulator [Streptomyces ferrugineus]|uniref:TetR/AcrR family transcriptional regulator n=1 Tax=Streptomyces ferrugineus TaxID=1413221 RepID=A0A7M2SCZ6_9ACTN|nr:TetR/AcrR family transcriptional regulator [Streptomyces ferrugineus]QOV34176.1 TetR/AcrR family transcriptional regulator [Streptomyces ferrugineus]